MKKLLYITLLWVALPASAQEMRISKAPGHYEMFGWQVSHNTDWIFVAAPFQDTGKSNAGAVHIYKKTPGGSSSKHQELVLPAAQPHTRFGKIMAHTDRYLVVSASKPISTSFGTAFMFLYELQQDQWVLVNTVKPDSFGYEEMSPSSLAIDDNLILVGNAGISSKYPNGQIALYEIQSNNQVVLRQRFTRPNIPQGRAIGHAVDIHDNMLAFSCADANGQQASGGQVYVYLLQNGQWLFHSTLEAPAGNTHDLFGYSLSVDYPSIAVSAIRHAPAQHNKKTGAVYVFKLNPNNQFNLEAKLIPDAAASHYDYFGSSISLHNNMLAVGANSDDFAGENTGAVYIFKRYGFSWIQMNKIIGTGVNDHALFGNSVSLNNGDVVCSSHMEESDTGNTDHGAVYYYRNAETVTSKIPAQTLVMSTILNIYPNPCTDWLTLRVSEQDAPSQLQIWDLKGSLIKSLDPGYTNTNGALILEIPVKELSAGTYVLSFKTGEGWQAQAFVKRNN